MSVLAYERGRNSWQVQKASHAAVIVDCANYYRAIHEAISRARHSIFIVGWDIDSRIELLRGAEANASKLPTKLFELVRLKARENPGLMVYLNRWDYSIYIAAEREGLSKIRWQWLSPRNVHYCLDNVHPFGGCHHQKVVVVDDRLAFIGGMDIALGRWDYRQHRPENDNRIDPGGTYAPHTSQHFGPHHDIMIALAGPVVKPLAELVRERWRRATHSRAIPCRDNDEACVLPAVWPSSIKPQFHAIEIALARTMPAMHGQSAIDEIERLYLDQIAQAERFIYMENQYFTRKPIAQALNRQLRKHPQLRALLVSCHQPQGIMERKSLWQGRVEFNDIMTQGVSDRVAMAYPVTREHGETEDIRIHSKLMTIDDRHLHIGSANINNRSMKLDTECDMSLTAMDNATAQTIAAIRDDLIREHTGMTRERIAELVNGNAAIAEFLIYKPDSRQHLRPVNDEAYRHQSFNKLATRFADADKPLLPVAWTMA